MDHCGKDKRKTNPRELANIFSLISFSYIVPLLKKAFKHDLQEEDLYEVLHSCNSKRCGDKLEKLWKKQTGTSSNPSILRLLWKRFGWRYAWMCSINVIWKTSRSIVEPYAITNFISYFSQAQTKMTMKDAYFYGALVIIVNLGQRLYFNNFLLWLEKLGIEIKVSFTSLLYRKSLRLTSSAVPEMTTGNIVTLITKDVQMLKESVYIVSSMASGIVQVCVVCYLIFAKIGFASFFGIGLLIAAMPLQIIIGRCVEKLRLKTGQKTDERLQVTQKTLSAIKIIKMYTWEKFFERRINEARRKELKRMLLEFYLRSVLLIIGILSSNMGLYVLIIAYIWTGFSTDTTIVFYLVTNFKEIKRTIGVDLPRNIGRAAEMISAMNRINKVLMADEVNSTNTVHGPSYKPLVELKEATVKIGESKILEGVSLKVDVGLTVVTGPVGSGKTSLLKVILNEKLLSTGESNIYGSISYASQEPWLFPSTIRQNILLGEEFDENRYQQTIRMCALQYDLSLMELGDKTIVTDNGSNLSKGQQTRINLARAIYKDTDIYLFDNVLSALDIHVQEYIFTECIETYLREKICILVSQTPNFVNRANTVILLDHGRIKEVKGLNDITSQKIVDFILTHEDRKENINEFNNESEIDESTTFLDSNQLTEENIYKERKKEGKVLLHVYHMYVMFAGGFILLFLNLVFGGIAQISGSFADKLLTVWVDEKQKVLSLKGNSSHFPQENITMNETLLKAESQENETFRNYSIMLFAATVLMLITSYVNFDFCRRASINIHKALVSNVIRATSAFFDSHYIGNVLNRFSEDLAQIDENFPFIFKELLEDIFSIMGQMSLVLSVDKYFLLYIALVFIVLLTLGKVYIPAGRSLKRLEASCRSPMIGHLNASLEGLITIRANRAQDILRDEFDRHQNIYTSALYTSICTLSAFTFFMDLTSSLLVIVVVVHFSFFDTGASGGNVGLALTQASMLGSTIQYALRKLSVLETSMTSVERLLEFIEIPAEKHSGVVLDDWPKEGGVKFENVFLAYKKETILKDLCFEVKPKYKIGIMGRTGAGKTSMISSIFRLYDYEGKIFIDGVDIRTLSLEFLRRKLAVIPQHPILFSGSVRSNIDPLGEFSDEDLWTVIEKVNMRNFVPNLEIEIELLTLSSGQKQLLSLARALLSDNKILILDEPLENMDSGSYALVQKTIREDFQDCTILTISHRMESILDCDKVMVINEGIIQEFENPQIALENEEGPFYDSVKKAGLVN